MVIGASLFLGVVMPYVHVIARASIAHDQVLLQENEPGILPLDVAKAFGANVQILGPAEDPKARRPVTEDVDETGERSLDQAPHDRMQRPAKNRSL